MKIRITVAGLVREFASMAEVARHFRNRSEDEQVRMASEKAEKHQRYHMGKMQAFHDAAKFLEALEFVDDETGQVVKDIELL